MDVAHLSKIFSVSVVTIRKDLEQLEKDGFLIRTYGGAVLNESNPLYYDMYVREFLEFIAGVHKIKDKKKEVNRLGSFAI